MIVPRISVSRRWLWLGIPPLLLGSLVTCLIVPGRIAAVVPNSVEVAVSYLSHDGPAALLVVKQHCRGSVLLMNWILEQKAERGWNRVSGETFSGGKLIDPGQGYSLTVTLPVEGTACRVRVQYGVGLHGLQLWRDRARVAWRTGRFMNALRYNEWEACESVADLIQ
jgi:hypothetical protein